tara:strand:- start:84 stop:533 length:450 start_codon:yes stop_codon:yes gene_type:complete
MITNNWLILEKKIKFGDCDSAGVIHFHNLLRWAHESWEESIEIYGIDLKEIFPSIKYDTKKIFPIIHCEANFLYPIEFGDRVEIKISPKKINNHLFEVKTNFSKDKILVARAKLIHCVLNIVDKKKVDLPESLELWIEASNINSKIECT